MKCRPKAQKQPNMQWLTALIGSFVLYPQIKEIRLHCFSLSLSLRLLALTDSKHKGITLKGEGLRRILVAYLAAPTDKSHLPVAKSILASILHTSVCQYLKQLPIV